MLRNTGIVDEFLSTSQVKKFPSGSILNFQGASVDVRMSVGRWQTSFSDFDYPNHRGLMSVPPGNQIYKQNADTRQECLHRTYSFALLLYHQSKMLSIELGALKKGGKSSAIPTAFTTENGCGNEAIPPPPKTRFYSPRK